MNPQAALPTRHLAAGTSIAEARPWQVVAVTLDSPALEVMTDLTQVKTATTAPSTSLHQAEQVMIYQGVRMLFVVEEMPTILGLITTTDLQGDRPLRVLEERRLHRDQLCVADVMTPLAALDAIEFSMMHTASVNNLVATLKRFGRNHLLVVDGPPGGPERVRGVISRAQIERQLGQTIDITEVANSFAELGQMLS
jgi:predicted transcriptional regulator